MTQHAVAFGVAGRIGVTCYFNNVRFRVQSLRGDRVQLCLGIGAEGRRIELLIQVVDFVECFFVGIGAIIVFFFGRVFGVVNLGLGVFGFVVLFKRTVHVDRADFNLRICGDRESEHDA